MLVDLNGDGLLDALQVNRWDRAQMWRQLPNEATKGNRWLQLRLAQPASNRDAVGAWVEVKIGEKIIRQELTVGGGHASGHMGWMHFGLGPAADVQVRVQWPNNSQSPSWGAWMNASSNSFYNVTPQGMSKWSAP
jgi:hypothetical protein